LALLPLGTSALRVSLTLLGTSAFAFLLAPLALHPVAGCSRPHGNHSPAPYVAKIISKVSVPVLPSWISALKHRLHTDVVNLGTSFAILKHPATVAILHGLASLPSHSLCSLRPFFDRRKLRPSFLSNLRFLVNQPLLVASGSKSPAATAPSTIFSCLNGAASSSREYKLGMLSVLAAWYSRDLKKHIPHTKLATPTQQRHLRAMATYELLLRRRDAQHRQQPLEGPVELVCPHAPFHPAFAGAESRQHALVHACIQALRLARFEPTRRPLTTIQAISMAGRHLICQKTSSCG